MTVLEWLKASTRFTLDDISFEKIACDRECDPTADAYSISKDIRDLMTADIIFLAVTLSPSSTSSLSQSHNGYQQTIGSEQNFYKSESVKYAMYIYRSHGESGKADMLAESQKKPIKLLPIEDVDSL